MQDLCGFSRVQVTQVTYDDAPPNRFTFDEEYGILQLQKALPIDG